MNRICIAALMTVMICGSGCGPSEQEALELQKKRLAAQEKRQATQELLELLGIVGGGGSYEDWVKSVESNPNAIRVLISKGANVNATGSNPSKRTPLMKVAQMSANPNIVKLLIDNGADVNARDKFGISPLHFAVIYYRSPQIVQLLIDNGAEVHAIDRNGLTPLNITTRSGTWQGSGGLSRKQRMILNILRAAGARQ